MKRLFALILSVALLFSNMLIVTAQPQVNQYIVLLDENLSPKGREVLEALEVKLVREFNLINGIVIRGTEKSIGNVTKHLNVLSIEEDHLVTAMPKKDPPGKPPKDDPPEEDPPTEDPPATDTEVIDWGVERVLKQPQNDYETAGILGQGVKVAVIDTGIDDDHTDLNVVDGVNYVAKARSYDDDNGHGTHVAGTIAALDNTFGVLGVAPLVDLYAVKVLDRRGSGYTSDVIAGVEWSISNQMDVINLSLGSDYPNDAFEQVLQQAADAGIITVAAAGNDSVGVDYPGAYDTTIAVAAVDSSNTIAYFSSVGPEVDISAPGVNINSTYKGDGYKSLNGTSMATPHVAGVAVLYKQLNSAGTYVDFLNAVEASAIPLGDVNEYGAGLIDASFLLPQPTE